MRLLMLKNQQRDHRLVWWGLFFLSSWTTTTCHARVFPPFPFPSTGGPIPEVSSCRSEDLEEANDSQLYTILQELTQTNFFRNFVVDLDQKCPLTTPPKTTLSKNNNNNNNYNKNPGASTSTNQPLDEPSKPQLQPPEEGCASEGLPDQDDDAGPACAVQDDVDDPFAGFGGQPFTTSSYDAQPPPTETTTTPPPLEEEEEEDEPNPPPQQPQEEEEFECNGGEDLDLDDDAEPLCHLTHEDMGYSSSPIQSLISMALQTIQYLGWESESQKDTYLWHQQTDMIVEDDTASDCDDNENDDDVVNDLFWQDMCSHIQAGDGTKVVNLVLNPERNTGYNGTHIWRAIYEENCLAPDKDDQQHHMMCYEERVLYRLLSGLHTSTTLSIAKHYYPPSKRKNRTHWEPNPEYFMTKFDGKVDYIRNLHFSYVVLLRALKKASSFLYHYDIRTGNPVEDETATILLRRLLDSGILKSCQSVFSAFDESLMFQEPKDSVTNQPQSHSLQESFKGVFHNISSILDCVQCQQCKLHGKMAMLGYGTALKILFIKNHHSLLHSLERNEIVAFINTIAKFSESMREIRELTATYWEEQPSSSSSSSSSTTTSSSSTLLPSNGVKEVELVDVAVGLAAKLAKTRHIEPHQEAALVQLAMAKTPELLILAKHYQDDATKFWQFAQAVLLSSGDDDKEMPDAIVVGSGLAGLSAALNLLDRGGRVVVVEKEHLLGGNSNKASSGINACCPHNDTYGDMLQSFYSDTVKSAGDRARPELVEVLVNHSASAVEWLKDRVGVDLSLLAQLGGHSHKRTHRPSNGMAGAEIIYGVQKAVRKYEKTGAATILTDTRVTELVVENDRVVGIRYKTQKEEEVQELRAHNIVLATGGFASDRRQDSYLAHYRPELLNMPATAGPFSTGDGIALATSLGAGITDMDKVQLHPTGWVDPADPLNPTKILAAELMRGVGGVLLNDGGQRFCNELGTRAYVTDRMLSHDAHYAATGVWDKSNPILDFALVLSSSAAASGQKHVDLYSHKKLLTRLEGVEALAHWLGLDVETVRDTLTEYRLDASKGVDAWGKTSFRGAPQQDLDAEVFYAGRVTPVLHYCMGGITIDAQGHVLDQESQQAIPGLHAAGEVTGGVHGANRLGGNSLLECTVFGSLVGRRLPIHTTLSLTTAQDKDNDKDASTRIEEKDRTVTRQELEEHNNDGDCWVAIHGVVYDLTEFAEEHPAGPESIRLLAGLDGTEAFQAVHNSGILDDFEDERVGILQDATEGGGGGAIANRTEESCNDTT